MVRRHIVKHVRRVFSASPTFVIFNEVKFHKVFQLGYVAFAADLFGKGVAGNDTINDNFPIVLKLLGERTNTLQSRILAAWDFVKGLSFVDEQKIACIGFSFGGLSCVDLARINVGLSAAVSFHGMIQSYPESNGTTSTSIQAHYGADDIYIETDIYGFVDELKALKADWQLMLYSDTVDGFTIPGVEKWGFIGYAYNEKSDRRSNAAMESFLAEKLWK
uniref:DLH domain-containing protein n=1 Tax=Angiostrongylus cantonensis TaxID=6313 RepID=A0A158PCN3_ANGCA